MCRFAVCKAMVDPWLFTQVLQVSVLTDNKAAIIVSMDLEAASIIFCILQCGYLQTIGSQSQALN